MQNTSTSKSGAASTALKGIIAIGLVGLTVGTALAQVSNPNRPNRNPQSDGPSFDKCSVEIEAVGTMNGRKAYRFTTNKPNATSNPSDGVFLSTVEYKVGHRVEFTNLRLNSSYVQTWNGQKVVNDLSYCRARGGKKLGNYQGPLAAGVPFRVK